jgi:hypothetical protein
MARDETLDRYNRSVIAFSHAHSWVQKLIVLPEMHGCSTCRAATGTFLKDFAPSLPHSGCERGNGCACWYAVVPATDDNALVIVSTSPPDTSADAEVTEYNERFITLLRTRPWIRNVSVHPEGDVCVACAHAARSIPANELPVLPHRHCTRPTGCGCWYETPAAIRQAS